MLIALLELSVAQLEFCVAPESQVDYGVLSIIICAMIANLQYTHANIMKHPAPICFFGGEILWQENYCDQCGLCEYYVMMRIDYGNTYSLHLFFNHATISLSSFQLFYLEANENLAVLTRLSCVNRRASPLQNRLG